MDTILNAFILGCSLVAVLLQVGAFAIMFAVLASWWSKR